MVSNISVFLPKIKVVTGGIHHKKNATVFRCWDCGHFCVEIQPKVSAGFRISTICKKCKNLNIMET